ncbi:NAD-glutamate dehydrogenase domain-containing protein [Rhodococcoides kroppenstedtii]|uniref:NAD-glutamate dehydrogenase domain-containing protein n=1 Tax=Rhodococcoides kroppenstedtii TaxID=293050 RepID=UPI0028E303A0|nr:NAD-glutamate dehydrogenase domain-containing protein [Rhodococcus kroppenstedtii]
MLLVPTVPAGQRAELPEGYKDDGSFEPRRIELAAVDRLTPGALEIDMYRPEGSSSTEFRMVLYVGGDDLTLHEILPILNGFALEVVDERPRSLTRPDGLRCTLYDFGLRVPTFADPADASSEQSTFSERMIDTIHAVRRGDIECDRFNALVLHGGLTWMQADILRAYAHYLRQLRFQYTQQHIERVLLDHIETTRALVEYFEARFAVSAEAVEGGCHDEAARLHVELLLESVLNLEADRVLRAFFTAITATLRTSYHRQDKVGDDGALGRRPYLALKLDPRLVPDAPEPRPHVETFVHSTFFEGTHLRFGAVARGGLRWSSRVEDFRTEVLGLVKAQAVKNAVIVPVGAKGGFVVKEPSSVVTSARPLEAHTAQECYAMFISALLDITDNLAVDGSVVHPPDVRVNDGPDTYLVVAADKGTASFSDLANNVAKQYDFWLGDGFASGGSVGYDHKKMGITAKGAWVSVTQHFAERGISDQHDEFTAVGIGDMSGDVFGNGLLLSRRTKLVAAFDHRHIFIDPDPNTDISFGERARLFALERSSWDDYDRSLISSGGGVWSRGTKSIAVGPEVRRALGIGKGTAQLAPHELIQCILSAPVDLLWNGGIGTYVKASTESHADVGDKANDVLRVDARDIRARVIGEGGNLGVTPLGRAEYARRGGAINTDAIDNSAGVDCSDHEVNIKVLVDRLVRDGRIDGDHRASLLASMAGDVESSVLAHNLSQNLLLGDTRQTAPSQVDVHDRLISQLEERFGLVRALEALPDSAAMSERRQADSGLVSSELATLIAHTKLAYKADVSRSGLPDDPEYTADLRRYFPAALREQFDDALQLHPLRRDIIVNEIVNTMVDRAGATFAFRLGEETGADSVDAARAFRIVSSVFSVEVTRSEIDRAPVPPRVRHALIAESRRLLDRAARWFLTNRPQPLDLAVETQRFEEAVRDLAPAVGSLLRGSEAAAVEASTARWAREGVPTALAREVSELLYRYCILDIVELSHSTGLSLPTIAELYFSLSDHLMIDKMLIAISGLPRDTIWSANARLSLRDDLYRSLRAITADVVLATDTTFSVDDRIAHWENINAARLARARGTLAKIGREESYDLTSLLVAIRQIRSMVSGLITSDLRAHEAAMR